MFIFFLMVIDQDRFNCCNTEVSSIIIAVKWLRYYCMYVDAANFDGLEKVQVAKLINGEFVYNSGENDSTVYAGLYS